DRARDDLVANRFVRDVGTVLRRHDDGADAGGLVVAVLDRDLALRVGTEPRDLALLALLREPLEDPVRVEDRRGHELGRLVAREAEHHSLITGALLRVQPLALGHALADVGALLLERDLHAAGIPVEALGARVVPDVADDLADDLRDLHGALRRDLSSHHHEPGLGEGLAGDARPRILREVRVEDRVRDLVAHLVRMAFGDRLGREQVVVETQSISPYVEAGEVSESPRNSKAAWDTAGS